MNPILLIYNTISHDLRKYLWIRVKISLRSHYFCFYLNLIINLLNNRALKIQILFNVVSPNLSTWRLNDKCVWNMDAVKKIWFESFCTSKAKWLCWSYLTAIWPKAIFLYSYSLFLISRIHLREEEKEELQVDEVELWPFEGSDLWSKENDWRSCLWDENLCRELSWHVSA